MDIDDVPLTVRETSGMASRALSTAATAGTGRNRLVTRCIPGGPEGTTAVPFIPLCSLFSVQDLTKRQAARQSHERRHNEARLEAKYATKEFFVADSTCKRPCSTENTT